MNMEELKKSSESLPLPLTWFSSLPYDVVLNILSRISIIHRPISSLVSKSFRSLIASRELEAIRTLLEKTEDILYVCLYLNKNNPNPRWFTLAPIPERQKLLPVPLFPYQHPEASTVVSIGTEIYIIGGISKGDRIRRVLVLDCQSHQWLRAPDSRSHKWRRLPRMRVPRVRPAAHVIDGKIYVTGGCKSNKSEDWGEVYDPKTQTWERLSPETLDLTTQKSMVQDRLVMGGKVYNMKGFKLNYPKYICLVEIDKNMLSQITVTKGKLMWNDANEGFGWRSVTGLKGLSPNLFVHRLVSVANSCGGRRVTVWWKTVEFGSEGRHYTKECKTDIWCAEISFERRSVEELWGVVEWSKSVFTFEGSDCGFDFVLDSAIITH